MFGLFDKKYNDWYSYLSEKEFPSFGYGETIGYNGLEFVEVKHSEILGAFGDNKCNASIPTGISCKIINSHVSPGMKLIELTCPKCGKLVEFDSFSVASTEMVERENKKVGKETNKKTIYAVDSGVYSKPVNFNF